MVCLFVSRTDDFLITWVEIKLQVIFAASDLSSTNQFGIL